MLVQNYTFHFIFQLYQEMYEKKIFFPFSISHASTTNKKKLEKQAIGREGVHLYS